METNDDFEEYEYFHETIGSHLNLIRQYLINLNLISISRNLDWLEKIIMRRTIYVFLIFIFITLFFCQTSSFWLSTFSKKLSFRFITKQLTRNSFSSQLNLKNIIYELKANQIGIYAIQGRRAKMEDKFSFKFDKLNGECQLNGNILKNKKENDLNKLGIEMFAIYDGHGGDTVSNYLQNNLLSSVKQTFDDYVLNDKINKCSAKNLINKTEELNVEKVSRILTEQTLKLDENLCWQLKNSRDISGATALIVIRLINTNELIVANIGDSRGVLCDNKGNAIALSFDHKPNHPKEWKRIYQEGGFVKFNGVWRVAGILATSRALGDYPLKEKNYIIANPDILTFSLNELKPKFAIFASDGLWDTFSNEAAVKFVREDLEKLTKNGSKLSENELSYELAKKLTLEAYKKGSLDNITVAIWIFNSDPIEKIKKHNFNIISKEKKNPSIRQKLNSQKDILKKIKFENKMNTTNLIEQISFSNRTDEIIYYEPIEYINVGNLINKSKYVLENKENNIMKENDLNLKETLEKNKIKTNLTKENKNNLIKSNNKAEYNICNRLKDEYNIIKIDNLNKSLKTIDEDEFFDVKE